MRDIAIIPGLEFKDDGESEYITVNGYAAYYGNIDRGDDCIKAGAFRDDLKDNGATRPCLWQHSSKDVIGNNYFVDGLNALSVTSKLPRNDELVKGRVFPQLKCGSLGGYSIGYDTIEQNYTSSYKEGKDPVRVRELIKCILYETSIVTIPMNPKCTILSVSKALQNIGEYKSYGTDTTNIIEQLAATLNPPFQAMSFLSDDTAWDKRKSEIDIKEHNGNSDCYINNYPIVYWIDGKFKLVPKGIVSAAVSMLDTKDSNLKTTINQLFKKINKEAVFENDTVKIDVDMIKSMNKKEFVGIFENHYKLSKSAREFIADGLKVREPASGGYDTKKLLNEIRQARMLLELRI